MKTRPNTLPLCLLAVSMAIFFCSDRGRQESRPGKSGRSTATNNGRETQGPVWSRYYGDTAIAVEILCAVYERQWSFMSRKGAWALDTLALQRPYVKGPRIPELPKGWTLELAQHWHERDHIAELLTADSRRYVLLPAKSMAWGSFNASGYIKGPGVDEAEICKGADRPFSKKFFDGGGRAGLEVTCFAHNARKKKLFSNPLYVNIVDADGDSGRFVGQRWSGLLLQDDIVGGSDDINKNEIDETIDECWVSCFFQKPFSAFYDVSVWSQESVVVRIRPQKCDSVVLTPGNSLRMKIIAADRYTIKEIRAECQDAPRPINQ